MPSFMIPYRPDARGQGRGNSGFYMVHLYEVQILDSFGLERQHNGMRRRSTKTGAEAQHVLPPLAWQTYDIDFTSAELKDGKKVATAKITARLNRRRRSRQRQHRGPHGRQPQRTRRNAGPLHPARARQSAPVQEHLGRGKEVTFRKSASRDASAAG